MPEEVQASALYRLIMSCFGHGIAIDDDGPNGPMATAFEKAGSILRRWAKVKHFDHSPCHFDQHQHFTCVLVDRHLVYAEAESECPNCHNGTVGAENGRLVCRGECGEDLAEAR